VDAERAATPFPPPGAIHIWLAALPDVPADGTAADEREKAARFRSASLTCRFIRKRAALRHILAT
jgi:hypothetical protein